MENIRKDAIERFIEFKKDSYLDSRVIRFENEKLNKFKLVLFEFHFSG